MQETGLLKENKMKVLMLNTSHNDLGMIRSLKKMGCYVVAIGNTPGLVGEAFADEYIQMDYSKKEDVLRLSCELNIDVICACCNDFGVVTAAYVAEKMGLPGHDTLNNVKTIHYKNLFKRLAEIMNISTPVAKEFDSKEKAYEYIQQGISYPSIVKPVDLSAGNGITKINGPEEGIKAIEYAFDKSRNKTIVIEPFITGTQHACCTFLKNRKVIACCSNNEYSIVNPYRVEIDTFPAIGFENVKDYLINEIERIAEKLDLRDGIFHVQYLMQDGKPYIMEAMRRVLGNMYSIPASKISNFDWDYWEARIHCGLDCENIPAAMEEKGFFAYRAIMSNRNGCVKDVFVDETLKAYIFDEFMLWEKGKVIKNYMSEPLGFLFMQFDSMEEMQRVMLEEYDKVRVIVED